MTRSEAIKAFFFKSVLPVIVALILYCIFKSACMKNGEIDYVWLWISMSRLIFPSCRFGWREGLDRPAIRAARASSV